ncbi:MAG TPA: oligosaccharide flippase family protein [Bacteroidales bacterium]|nr:oligosaccharide flippase family protein [Bacteroidales bacterium]HOH22467.1 oligosaccharide flippase family protein [Bacteroidales bacterium]HPB58195.1 oligosaccharide flippase family protein [Bacteroidales bacterium]HPZ03124.1 oligosaccharide flippase family protein [Bacteroidales bacterium]HQB74746.1 oligosaccharide flippase family protein [Bacteroidales bacterium]
MKQNDFVFNIFFLLFLNLLIKPFWVLGIDVGVQNRVGAEQYGLYFAVFNFTFLFNTILDMGITNFNNRNIARHNHLLQKHISGIITLKLLLAALYLLITFVAAFFIGYEGIQLKILLFAAINQALNSFILYLRSNISALLYFKIDSVLSVLDRLLMILICSYLLWGGRTTEPFQIVWFLYAQTAAYIITAATALIIILTKIGRFKLSWNRSFALMILKKSFPFAILYLLMSFYNRIDSVMIERILPESIAAYQTGVYASVFRLLDALVMISYLFSVILLPLFSKMLKNKEEITPIIRSSFSLLFFFSITAVVILLFYRVPILELLYRDHISASARVLQFLIPCLIPISFTYIFGTLLTANGNMRMLNITSLIGIGLNIILNLVLIPCLHATGAAIASLSTQTLICVIQFTLALKILGVSIKVLPIGKTLLYLFLFVGGVYLIYTFLPLSSLYMIVISCIFAVLLAFATQLIPFSLFKGLKIQNN